jgi:hypothetical protein
MLTEVRSKLTYPYIASTLALFLALTGGAFALQGKNKVDSGDIRKNAVKSSDIAKNAAKGGDVNEGTLGEVPSATTADNVVDNAINGAKVADGSLGGVDIDESTLGSSLDLTYARNDGNCTVPEGTQDDCTATCPAGLNAIGGGGVAEGSFGEQIDVNGSRPNPNDGAATGWTTFFNNNDDDGATNNDNVTAYAVCAPARAASFIVVGG